MFVHPLILDITPYVYFNAPDGSPLMNMEPTSLQYARTRHAYYARILDEYPILEPSFLYKAAPGLNLPYIYAVARKSTEEVKASKKQMREGIRPRVLCYLDLIFQANINIDARITNPPWLQDMPVYSLITDPLTFVFPLGKWPLIMKVEKSGENSPWASFAVPQPPLP
ncbi:uncharacterized protein PAC_18232 [Phialocephala subalpina]|uniref:Uncharacterized protein n=1 Tax=Phialocephala subalpina TaxID=576137 RepID=A0A1L7XTG5_9HELO|nr:uncharacterized protein PAC_18232 [Phialocephala subalpina]